MSLREQMPQCAAFLDDLRQAFGKAEVDQMIREGLANGTFYAAENGYEVGRPPEPRNWVVPYVPPPVAEPVSAPGRARR